MAGPLPMVAEAADAPIASDELRAAVGAELASPRGAHSAVTHDFGLDWVEG
jgi:hypothetical protein